MTCFFLSWKILFDWTTVIICQLSKKIVAGKKLFHLNQRCQVFSMKNVFPPSGKNVPTLPHVTMLAVTSHLKLTSQIDNWLQFTSSWRSPGSSVAAHREDNDRVPSGWWQFAAWHQYNITDIIHNHCITASGICLFVCLFVNTITSKWVNTGCWNSGMDAFYEFEYGVIAPWVRTP